MLDVRRMRVLREVAARGSIAAAAEALGYSPSAVSQQIATLEREVGVSLVERRASSLSLTEAGRTLAGEADDILARLMAIEARVQAVSGLGVDSVRLGAFATAGPSLLTRSIAAYAREHPAVEVSVLEGDPEDCLPRLRAGDLDLVLTYEYDLVPLQAVDDLRRVPLLHDPIRAVMPSEHPAAEQQGVRLEDLRKDGWIAEPRADCFHFSVRACEATGFKPSVRFLSSDYRLSLALVAAAGVVTLIPQLALEEMPPGVAVRPLAGTSLVRRVDVTYRVGTEGTPALGRMIEVLRSVAATYDGTHDDSAAAA